MLVISHIHVVLWLWLTIWIGQLVGHKVPRRLIGRHERADNSRWFQVLSPMLRCSLSRATSIHGFGGCYLNNLCGVLFGYQLPEMCEACDQVSQLILFKIYSFAYGSIAITTINEAISSVAGCYSLQVNASDTTHQAFRSYWIRDNLWKRQKSKGHRQKILSIWNFAYLRFTTDFDAACYNNFPAFVLHGGCGPIYPFRTRLAMSCHAQWYNQESSC